MSIEKKFNGKFRGAMDAFLNKQNKAAAGRNLPRPASKKRR